MIKECKIHGLTEFTVRNEKRERCKKCAVDAVMKRRTKVKQLAIDYKGGKCEICEYSKYNGALEFHHLEPNEKEFNIGRYGHSRSWERVKNEIDKCILVCSNCHKEIHGNIIKLGYSSEAEQEFVKFQVGGSNPSIPATFLLTNI